MVRPGDRRRWLVVSSSSLAGGSPVRVAVRRPGSRLAAWSGNGPGRSPASKALQGEATAWSVTLREACGVVRFPVARQGKGEPSPPYQGEGHGSGEDPGCAAAKNSPAYGARNVQIVTAGTGEALPGPATCGWLSPEATHPITSDPGKWVTCRVGVGGGHSTD